MAKKLIPATPESHLGLNRGRCNLIGRLQLGVLMAVAEFERSLIRERTKAGQITVSGGKLRGQALWFVVVLSLLIDDGSGSRIHAAILRLTS
jgi:hypothetical protein